MSYSLDYRDVCSIIFIEYALGPFVKERFSPFDGGVMGKRRFELLSSLSLSQSAYRSATFPHWKVFTRYFLNKNSLLSKAIFLKLTSPYDLSSRKIAFAKKVKC
jgi:hypothetical protein